MFPTRKDRRLKQALNCLYCLEGGLLLLALLVAL
jgi:hypothetical protein